MRICTRVRVFYSLVPGLVPSLVPHSFERRFWGGIKMASIHPASAGHSSRWMNSNMQ
jgi:hypothetical protein